MIIGFDAKRIVRNATGLGNYARSLVNDLAALGDDHLQLRLYAPDAGRDQLRRQVSTASGVCLCYPPAANTAARLLPAGLYKAWWRSAGVVRQLQADGVQLYHGLSGELPLGLRDSGVRGIVTIHDLIFMRHPEYYHPWDRWMYEWKFRQTLRQAHRIIAISECTRRDVATLGGISPDRIDLIYQTCHPRYAEALPPDRLRATAGRLQLPQCFLLSVGSIEERKNLLLAVSALPLLPERLHLVAVGKATPYAKKVAEAARRMGVAERLHMLHGVSDTDLQALYQLAQVFVYPSRYEGFGIPVIEAIQSGLPVVACTGSCLEEAGGPDSLYVAPDDAPALAAAIGRMLPGAPERMGRIERSRRYVRRFEGGSVAAQVAAIYREELHNRG